MHIAISGCISALRMIERLTNLELGLGIDGLGFGLGPSFCDAIFSDAEVL